MIAEKMYKSLGRQLNVTVELMQMVLDAQLGAVTDLSAMQITLLMILHDDQFMPLDQVVKDSGDQGLKNFLEPLLKHGAITQVVRDDQSGVVLTKSGEELITKLWPIIDKTEEKILQGFKPNEKKQFGEYIARIQENCYTIVSEE